MCNKPYFHLEESDIAFSINLKKKPGFSLIFFTEHIMNSLTHWYCCSGDSFNLFHSLRKSWTVFSNRGGCASLLSWLPLISFEVLEVADVATGFQGCFLPFRPVISSRSSEVKWDAFTMSLKNRAPMQLLRKLMLKLHT